MKIVCQKVRFLHHPVSKSTLNIPCIILTDGNGERYYYFYPTGSAPLHTAEKQLREQLTSRELTLICYRDTRVINTLDIQ